MGYDLGIEQLCKRYKKLPSEVLEEGQEWIDFMLQVMVAENKRRSLEDKRSKQKSNARR